MEVKKVEDERRGFLQMHSLGKLLREISNDADTNTGKELFHSLGRPVKSIGDTREQVVETSHVLIFVITQHRLELILELGVVTLDQYFFASTSKLTTCEPKLIKLVINKRVNNLHLLSWKDVSMSEQDLPLEGCAPRIFACRQIHCLPG